MSESASAPAILDSPSRCGSCFFELPNGVPPLPEDKPARVGMEVFYVAPSLPTKTVKKGLNLMRNSAERGCSSCDAMHRYLVSHISTQDTINWDGKFDTGMNIYCGPVYPPATVDETEAGPKDVVRISTGEDKTREPDPREDADKPPTMSFDLFCLPYAGSDTIPEFKDQDCRKIHPFLTTAAHPSGDTKSPFAMTRLKDWLATCLSNHNICGKAGEEHSTFLPGRILRLEDHNTLRVIENIHLNEPYACLSHRWGESTVKVSLLSTNLSRYKAGILVSSLPQLFRDVIFLCHTLGLQYLWIDSLCIVQDDLEDWETVAATMGSIYENAFITISAAWDSNSDQSLFNEISPFYLPCEIPTSHDTQTFIRRQYPHPWSSIRDDPNNEASSELSLLKRGWVFQERALSKRIIHFTPYELCWECVERTCCECRLNEGQWNTLRSKVPRSVANQGWDKIVQEYSILDLSFDKDKLQALAGVSRRYAIRHGYHFLAGLWAELLVRDFVWRRLQFSNSRPRPDPVVAPTWSWASINGPIWMKHRDKCENMEFLDFDYEPLGIDPYGSTKVARLLISGLVITGRVYYGEEWKEILRERSIFTANTTSLMQDLAKSNLLMDRYNGIVIQDGVYRWLPDYSVDVAGPYQVPSGSEVCCILCCNGAIAGVILRASEKHTGCYERLGVLDNDPFVPVPVEDLREKAIEKELVLV